jgi:DNA-binding beta-propeller fold protein YncE
MQKKMAGVMILLVTLFFASAVWASPWGIVANCGSGTTNSTIQTIDLGTTPGTVYGPFLSGTSVTGLGGDGGLFEVAVVPGGQYALVSNFGDSIIYRVDISNLTNPVLTDFIEIGFFAEDIAISPNGQFAVVTDGGFSDNLAFINLSTFNSSGTSTLTDGGAQAVAIGPDNQTVIMCDYSNSQIVYGTVNAGLTGLVSGTTLTTSGVSGPVNVEIGPDGTVLVANGAMFFLVENRGVALFSCCLFKKIKMFF